MKGGRFGRGAGFSLGSFRIWNFAGLILVCDPEPYLAAWPAREPTGSDLVGFYPTTLYLFRIGPYKSRKFSIEAVLEMRITKCKR